MMHELSKPMAPPGVIRADRFSAVARSFAIGLAAVLAAPGCHHEQKKEIKRVGDPPVVRIVRPEKRDIVRAVGQPSFVEAYERTSIYPKLTAYIKAWHVDIGDPVKKDQTLADLFAPDLVEDWKKKGASVEFDKKCVKLAETKVEVAGADVQVAQARLKVAKAAWEQAKSEVTRWESEAARLRREVDRGVVDPQTLLEAENQLRENTAAREAAAADIAKAEADLQSKQASLGEDQVGVKVAQANVSVAESDYKRMTAWVDYLKLYAPFDGVVVARNANTWDFVMPASGDPSADRNAPYLSPSGQSAPIYVVDRTDVLRVFVDIPEQSADHVHVGSKAIVLIKAFWNQPILATVTRTSWALNVKSRTLRAEIDLPNTGSQIPSDVPEVVQNALKGVKLPATDDRILPGMYAYGKVILERYGVRALPADAVTKVGDKTFYWAYEDGKAVQNEVQTGVSDGKWVEVIHHRRRTSDDEGTRPAAFDGLADGRVPSEADGGWAPFTGSEQVILGDLSILSDGGPVQIASPKAKAEVASVAEQGI
jgi:multidrug efflux pump subunit AcrA (membrane-fusion protein)